MATETPKLGISKPEEDDETVVREDFNAAMDIIDAAVPVSGVVSVSADYTVGLTDRYVVVDASAGLVIITLPDAPAGTAVTIIRTDELDADQTQIQVSGTSVSNINGRLFYIFMQGAYEFVCVDGTAWACSTSPFDFAVTAGDPTVPNTTMVLRWSPGGFGPAAWTIAPINLESLGDAAGVAGAGDGQVVYWNASLPGWATKYITETGMPLFVGDDAPSSPPTQYVWIQTGLGVGGDEMTFWVEDGT